jgi:4-diphosphocytidyl-2-C-methyl-D-erythritol kinase
MLATGTGTILKPIDLSLKGYLLCLVKPPVDITTREAYENCTPQKPSFSLEALNTYPVSEWKEVLINDFEPSIFKKHPVIRTLKDKLYTMGAEYAAMSGSGSAVFGLFKETISPKFPNCFVWTGTLA